MTAIPEHLVIGPKAGVDYPLSIQYCGNCSMPIEVNKKKCIPIVCSEGFLSYSMNVFAFLSFVSVL